MKVFLDTNVLLDVLIPGRPQESASRIIFSQIRKGRMEAELSTQSIIDASYVCSRAEGFSLERFRSAMLALLGYVNVNGINYFELRDALLSGRRDIEDAAQASHASRSNCHVILSADKSFRLPDGDPSIPVMTPAEFVERMKEA
jgi:predicted nucleic acid-binding protein